jgi:membrane-bound lytic murein transglycosylase B
MLHSGIAVLCIIGLLLPLSSASAETDAERKARLERELVEVERQILKQQVLVEDKQLERRSLERDLQLLDAQIKKARLGIQARAVAIEQLEDQIGDKEAVITELSARLDRQRQSLGQLIRKTQEIDDYTLVEILLGKENFSRFFEDLESFQSIKLSLNESLNLLAEIKSDTEEQKESLEGKQLAEAEMKRVQEFQKQEVEKQEQEKAEILTVTKGEEAAYQRLLESQQKTAAELRNQLFELLGGGGGIPLPEAVRLAEYASGKTGVPASLILAVLEQETNIGSHLGSCAYNDIRDGRAVMHPDRDQPVFLVIASTLGFDARSRQVSCPITSGGKRVGWGGAMGPSQFIPSTWAIYGGLVNSGSGWIYDKSQDVIRSLNGKSTPANPFDNQDAFLATALLLRDNGANGGYAADRLAALRYYAGWGGASNPANAFYGDQVMSRKAKFEGQIKVLKSG